jgi:ribonuclease P protein component
MAKIPKIKRNSEFQAIFRSGRIWSNAVAVLYMTKASGEAASRLGICVSKKLGKAFVRNRIKRLIYEVCRLRWPSLKSGCNLIVLARRGALEKSFGEVEQALDELFRRARLAPPPPSRAQA